jgi:hypothetical protein
MLTTSIGFASEKQQESTEWISNESLLQFNPPAMGEQHYPWLSEVKSIVVRSLKSPDQARDFVNMHNTMGTKAQSFYAKYVGPRISVPAAPNTGQTIRNKITKSMQLYAQKETKGNIFPQSWKDGLRFNIGGGASSSSGPGAGNGYIHNGNPAMLYGLRLVNIEPAQESMKLASNALDDYEYLRYAPKAQPSYEIGEVYPDAGARSFPTSIPSGIAAPLTFWEVLPPLPDFKFSGRMAPRGLPGPGSPLPPQSVFLDQNQGYYQMEAQMTGNLKQEAVVHRFRAPLFGKMNYRQERNKDWQFTKSTFENIYANDRGLAVHLERYHLEHRYQLGVHFHNALRHLQLYAHVPDKALESENFWRQHRWETSFDLRF